MYNQRNPSLVFLYLIPKRKARRVKLLMVIVSLVGSIKPQVSFDQILLVSTLQIRIGKPSRILLANISQREVIPREGNQCFRLFSKMVLSKSKSKIMRIAKTVKNNHSHSVVNTALHMLLIVQL